MKTRSLLISTLALSLTLTACVDSMVSEPSLVSEHDALQRITGWPKAVLLAVDLDTVQLSVAGWSIAGDSIPVAGGAPVIWKSMDSRIVVDSMGRVSARGEALLEQNTDVIASWTYNGTTKVDTIVVQATATRLPIAGLKIIPMGDSTRSSTFAQLGGLQEVALVQFAVVDADNNVLATPRVDVQLTSKRVDLLQFIFGFYMVLGGHIGDYWMYASSSVYGIPMRDSLKYTGLYPINTKVEINQNPVTQALTSLYNGMDSKLQPCGYVIFTNSANRPIDIIFDEPNRTGGCGSANDTGNIIGLSAGASVNRTFASVGTVRWTARDPNGSASQPQISGTISVKVP